MRRKKPALPTPISNLRIVLEHRTGPLARLHQIIGHASVFEDGPLPLWPSEPPMSLVGVKRGYVWYREIVAPEGLGRFDRAQR